MIKTKRKKGFYPRIKNETLIVSVHSNKQESDSVKPRTRIKPHFVKLKDLRHRRSFWRKIILSHWLNCETVLLFHSCCQWSRPLFKVVKFNISLQKSLYLHENSTITYFLTRVDVTSDSKTHFQRNKDCLSIFWVSLNKTV